MIRSSMKWTEPLNIEPHYAPHPPSPSWSATDFRENIYLDRKT